MDLKQLGELVDKNMDGIDETSFHQWLHQRRGNYNLLKFGKCECGKPANKEYAPCCSYICWSKKFDK